MGREDGLQRLCTVTAGTSDVLRRCSEEYRHKPGANAGRKGLMTLHPAIEILQNLHLTQELHERWEARTVAGYHFVVSKKCCSCDPNQVCAGHRVWETSGDVCLLTYRQNCHDTFAERPRTLASEQKESCGVSRRLIVGRDMNCCLLPVVFPGTGTYVTQSQNRDSVTDLG